MGTLFPWHGFDVRPLLPPAWDQELLDLAASYARDKTLVPTSVTSREAADVTEVPVTTVGGLVLTEEVPWLDALYRHEFRKLAEDTFATTVACADDRRIGLNLNVQTGTEQRYEAHVDSNPIEGLLYVTTHAPGDGGELVVANRSDAMGIDQIESDRSIIYPVSGHLLFFDARRNPHYVRALRQPGMKRVVVAMNFYTNYSTEADRPSDLNSHLFGSE